jgi:GNAT superfamily N-acetyltransferase
LLDLLDNVTWHALSGLHARFAAGAGSVRRYAKGFSPILGLEDPDRPDFDTLARYCDPGEHFYAERWTGRAPAGWRIDVESTMFKMVWDSAVPPPEPALDAVPLAAAHAEQAVALAALTRPGPFGPRTIELGEYLGVFADGALVAMAGERMQAAKLREISGVCTHPSFQGRGLARQLMHELLRRELRRGETPFLHVMRDNVLARDLYRRMGFREHREVVVRVVARS